MRRSMTPVLAALLLAACTYQGTLTDAGYTPSAGQSGAKDKIAASVAFIDDGSIDKIELNNPNRPYGYKLAVGPAMKEAILGQLRASFRDVTVVSKPGDEDKADLYAIPDVAWVRVPDPSAFAAYRVGLQMAFAARESRQIIGGFREVVPMSFSPPGDAVAAGLAGAVTLFALAPVTEPMKADAVGKAIEQQAREAIGQVVHKLGDDIANDQRLRDRIDLVVGLGAVQPSPGAAAAVPSQYDKYLDAVVTIEAGRSLGAGFFISADGRILTCRHVVGDAQTVTVKDRAGHSFSGTVLGTNKDRDLALVKVEGAAFKTLALASERAPPVGRDVITIGTAHGLSWSVSKGIVSGIRSLRTAQVIQTDAAFSEGSSGGPLIDVTSGQVVGVASISMGGVGNPANFAIAADEARKAFGPALKGL
jgi:S1-C subfamily serine protease